MKYVEHYFVPGKYTLLTVQCQRWWWPWSTVTRRFTTRKDLSREHGHIVGLTFDVWFDESGKSTSLDVSHRLSAMVAGALAQEAWLAPTTEEPGNVTPIRKAASK